MALNERERREIELAALGGVVRTGCASWETRVVRTTMRPTP
jgi:hypothetical protein